ncbi:MAG: prmA 1 [Solimicrobium sp.]|jgi:methylase of polypeptide subunit release factors|nr:prmA 1 [Solimicrobium sp.]
MKTPHEIYHWQDAMQTQQAKWRAENGSSPPKKFILADDTLTADTAYKLACEGCGLLWQGDFQLARQLLQALARRCDRPARKSPQKTLEKIIAVRPAQAFNLHRQSQSQRSRVLSMLLIPLNFDYSIPLKRAPHIIEACTEAYGEPKNTGPNFIVSLRELQGLIGAHEWRKKGIIIPTLDGKIYPHYGVFSPVRGEYISLVANAPLRDTNLAFDIGTGTGVLAALLAKRGVQKVIGTDQDQRALICARANLARLGYSEQVEIIQTDLFPDGKASLIVCNPPWLPARPSSPIEHAIFDPESRMLRGFLTGLAGHLTANGEGWLLLSDFAEHLELRSREELLEWIKQAGLRVIDRVDVKPDHPKTADQTDLLYQARAAEITSLWRLTAINKG